MSKLEVTTLIGSLAKIKDLTDSDIEYIKLGLDYLHEDCYEESLVKFRHVGGRFSFFPKEYPLVLQYIQVIIDKLTDLAVEQIRSFIQVKVNIIFEDFPVNKQHLKDPLSVDFFVSEVSKVLDTHPDIKYPLVGKDLLNEVVVLTQKIDKLLKKEK